MLKDGFSKEEKAVFHYFEAILATSDLFTFMAPLGQNSWQQKHRTHFLLSILAFPFTISIALAGQPLTQWPQAVQLSSGAGFERIRIYSAFFRI